MDVGCAARGQHRRLAAPAHRDPLGRPAVRPRHPRRASHGRHPAAPAHPGPGPAGPSRRRARPAPTTRTPAPRRGPRPHPRPARNVLTSHHGPDTTGDPPPEATLGPSACAHPKIIRKTISTPARRSTHRLLADSGLSRYRELVEVMLNAALQARHSSELV